MSKEIFSPSSRFIFSLNDLVLENAIDNVRGRLTCSIEEINDKNEYNQTPLMLAAEKGYMEIVRILLDFNPRIEEKNHDGMTALTFAIVQGNEEIVRELLARGADPLYAKSYMESSQATTYHLDRQNLLDIVQEYILTEEKQKALRTFFSGNGAPGFFLPKVLEPIIEAYATPVQHLYRK